MALSSWALALFIYFWQKKKLDEERLFNYYSSKNICFLRIKFFFTLRDFDQELKWLLDLLSPQNLYFGIMSKKKSK
jgi:hypothetical protein